MDEQMREKFEAWAKGRGYIARKDAGEYIDFDTRQAWPVWQAAALSQPAAAKGQTINGNCQRLLMNEGKPYPRTCKVCGLFGPCHYGPQPKATP